MTNIKYGKYGAIGSCIYSVTMSQHGQHMSFKKTFVNFSRESSKITKKGGRFALI